MSPVLPQFWRALLSRRAHYAQSLSFRNHGSKSTHAGVARTTPALSSTLRRATDVERTHLGVGCNLRTGKKPGGRRQSECEIISGLSHPSGGSNSNQLQMALLGGVRCFGSSGDGSLSRVMAGQQNGCDSGREIRMPVTRIPWTSNYHSSSQSASLRPRVGDSTGTRGMSASSRRDPRNNRKGFLDMRSFQSAEEAAGRAFEMLDDLKHQNLAAFWGQLPLLIDPRKQGDRHIHQSERQYPQEQLRKQLNSIFLKTMGGIHSFSPKHLSQTALGFAKITKIIDSRQRQSPPHHVLCEILIGQDSKHQKEIFQEITNAAVRIFPKFDARCLSNLSYANALVGSVPVVQDGRSLFQHIAETSIPLLEKFKPQELSNMVWSFEKVGASNPELFKNVGDRICVLGNLHTFKLQELSNTVLAFAKAGESHPRLFGKIADHIIAFDSLHLFKPQELSNTVWGFTKAKQFHPGLFKKVADHILAFESLYLFKPQELSNTVWAFAKAQESHPRLLENGSVPVAQDGRSLFDHIAEISVPLLDKFKPQELSNMVWSFEKVGASSPKLFRNIGDRISALDNLHGFKSQGLSNTVLAFAKAGESHPMLFEKIANHIVTLDSLNQFYPQGISNTMWAFAKAGQSHPRLFEKVANHICALDGLHPFKPQELSNTVWGFATAKESHPMLFEKIANHILALDSLHPFKPQELSNTVWGFATAKESHPMLFEKIANHILALDSLHPFKPQELSNTVWAFATAGESHPGLFRKISNHILALDSLHIFSPQQLSNTVWAFATAKESHPMLFEKIADHVLALDSLHHFQPQSLSNIMWSFATADVVNVDLFEKVADHVEHHVDYMSLDRNSQHNLLWAFQKAEKARDKEVTKQSQSSPEEELK